MHDTPPATIAVRPAAADATTVKAVRMHVLARAIARLKRIARFAYDLLTHSP